MQASCSLSRNLALYLPRNSDIIQLRQRADEYTFRHRLFNEDDKVLLSYLHSDGHCKAMCAYFGDLAKPATKDFGTVMIDEDALR